MVSRWSLARGNDDGDWRRMPDLVSWTSTICLFDVLHLRFASVVVRHMLCCQPPFGMRLLPFSLERINSRHEQSNSLLFEEWMTSAGYLT